VLGLRIFSVAAPYNFVWIFFVQRVVRHPVQSRLIHVELGLDESDKKPNGVFRRYNFPSASSKFSTEKNLGDQKFNLASKFKQNAEFWAPNLVFLEADFLELFLANSFRFR